MINRFCRENGFCILRKQVDAKKRNHFKQQRNVNYDELSYESFVKSEENDSLKSFPERKLGFEDEPPKSIIKAMEKRAQLDVLSNKVKQELWSSLLLCADHGWMKSIETNQSK